ncbi:MAG TPA: RNA polymerase sigma-70 factor [Candidatus Butyricimonas faecavium]|nr:RNA polymerase sigma-70 factor [Candidatus Butyricimonas faecavium]
MKIDETQILRGVNNKDEKAWKSVFIYYYAALCSYADRIIKNTIVAEDLVQEVLMNIWKNTKKFPKVDDLTYYLYRATYNQAMMHLRQEKFQERYVQQFLQEENVEFTDEEFADTVREELIRQLYFYIDELPEERRKIILLSIKGHSGNEIAKELDISINTVKTQKSRSFKYLRNKMKGSSYLFWLTIFLS